MEPPRVKRQFRRAANASANCSANTWISRALSLLSAAMVVSISFGSLTLLDTLQSRGVTEGLGSTYARTFDVVAAAGTARRPLPSRPGPISMGDRKGIDAEPGSVLRSRGFARFFAAVSIMARLVRLQR